jgi:hypothetical protein
LRPRQLKKRPSAARSAAPRAHGSAAFSVHSVALCFSHGNGLTFYSSARRGFDRLLRTDA